MDPNSNKFSGTPSILRHLLALFQGKSAVLVNECTVSRHLTPEPGSLSKFTIFKFCLIFAGYHPFDFIDILLLCSSTIENPLNVVQDWNLEWCWLWLCHRQQINIWPIWLVKFLNFGLAITIPNAVFSQRSLLWLNRFRRNLDTRMSKLVL